jgi:hypothetical protein
MNIFTKLTNLFVENKTYSITPIKSTTTDIQITHKTGVVISIEYDGSVIVSSPNNLTLHATGNLELSSGSHIGLVAPRIDLN